MKKSTFKTNESERSYNEGWSTGYDDGYNDGYTDAEKSETVKEKCGIGAAMVAATSVCVGLAAIGGARLYVRLKNRRSKRFDDESETTINESDPLEFEEDKEDFDVTEYIKTSDAPLDDSDSNAFCEENKKAMEEVEKDPRFSDERIEEVVPLIQKGLGKLRSDIQISQDESRKRCNRKNLISFARGIDGILEENDNGLTEDDKAELKNIMDQINDKIQPSSDPDVPEILKPCQDDGDDSKSDATSDTDDESISESAATSEEKPVDPKSIEKVNQKFSSGEDKQKGGKRKKSKGQRR